MMKKSIFALTLLLLFSCSNDDKSLPVDQVPGLWTWKSTDGGINNSTHQTPASTGQNITLEIKSDNTYIYKTNGTVTSQGTYSFVEKPTIYSSADKMWIDFSNDEDRVIFQSTANVLQLADNLADGFIFTYEK